MSGIVDKIKEKVAELKSDHKTTGSTNAGPHDSNVANKADPRVDSDLDGGRHAGLNQTTGTHGTTGTGLTGTHGTTGTGLTGTHGSTNAGPHNTNTANALDPRVDSDLDGSRNAGLNQTTGTHGTTGTGLTGTHGTTGYGNTGVHSTSGIGSSGANTTTTAGPHSSNLANKLDPRVDSDLSGGHPGSNAAYTHTGQTGSGLTGNTSSGLTGTHNTHGSTNAGPHNSNAANYVDPRVDSDLDGSRNAGLNQTTHHNTASSGLTGTHHTHGSTNAGPHSSNAANYVDPRVDSDLDGSRNAGLNQTTHHNTTTGTGLGNTSTTSSSTTAGPHNSNLLNKLDPRVDSDLSGGHPGSNAAYTGTGTTGTTGSNTY